MFNEKLQDKIIINWICCNVDNYVIVLNTIETFIRHFPNECAQAHCTPVNRCEIVYWIFNQVITAGCFRCSKWIALNIYISVLNNRNKEKNHDSLPQVAHNFWLLGMLLHLLVIFVNVFHTTLQRNWLNNF